jgi:hypothetical protein
VNPLIELKNAAIGWLDLIAAKPSGAERFNMTRAGLINALAFYFILVLFTRIVQSVSLQGNFPRYDDIFVALVLNALPLLAIFLVSFVTVQVLKSAVGILGFLVPSTYALVFLLLIGLPLSLFAGSTFSTALQGILGYMLYRLARDIGKFNIGISIAFAVLSIVLLVAVPVALYMLFVREMPTPS